VSSSPRMVRFPTLVTVIILPKPAITIAMITSLSKHNAHAVFTFRAKPKPVCYHSRNPLTGPLFRVEGGIYLYLCN
jgi:hypothetical protein